MKFLILLLLLFFCDKFCNAQQDTSRHHLSTNLLAGILSGETGIYYDFAVSKTSALGISYAHRFWQFNIIENGGHGSAYKYLPQEADIVRFAIRQSIQSKQNETASKGYIVAQLGYWQMQTSKYTNSEGSNGLNLIKRNVISVERKLITFSFGFGAIRNWSKHLYSDAFIKFGFGTGKKYEHYYSYGLSGGDSDYLYPANTIKKKQAFWPMLDVGYSIGYCW